jgi:GNAT superfamily N-acetyltransferase
MGEVRDATDSAQPSPQEEPTDLLIRPARSEDRDPVMAIAAQIWEGHDYLPEVWESWLHDPAGPMIVAVLAGVPAAVAKITLQSPTEAWLAGMRVDPAQRGRGLASAMTAYLLRWLDERHIPIARFSTSGDNTPIHHIAAQLGFQRITAVDHKHRGLEPGLHGPAATGPRFGKRAQPAESPRLLTPDEEAIAWEMVTHSTLLRATQGLYGVGWTWMRFRRSDLQKHLARGEVSGWGPGPAALAIAVHRSARVPRYVSLVTGARDAGLALLRTLGTVPHLVVEDPASPPQLRMPVPEGDPDSAWMAEQAGLAAGDFAMWLFQRDAREVRQ